jgi:hypothetical protein
MPRLSYPGERPPMNVTAKSSVIQLRSQDTCREIQFENLMEPVAIRLLGEPNRKLSKPPKQMRFGTHGSMAVDIEHGRFFDHEAQIGGGVIDLIMRTLGCDRGSAVHWLRTEGFIPERRSSTPAHNGATGAKAKAADETKAEAQQDPQVEICAYSYCDERRALLFQVVRYSNPKTFRQRRPGERPGEWIWSVEGVRHVPYRLPGVIEAVDAGKTIFITEGEKDVDNLVSIGFTATTNAGGSGKWLPEYNEQLRGADVVLVPHNDDTGRDHAHKVATALTGIAKRIRLLEIWNIWPECGHKQDVSDWLKAGGDAAKLKAAVDGLPEWKEAAKGPASGGLPVLFINSGNLPATADTLRDLISASSKFYDRDGPARVINSAGDGSPMVVKMTRNNVIREAHRICQPVKPAHNDGVTHVTLPDRLAQMYLDMVGEWGLDPLVGISTSPLLSPDGDVRSANGYDRATKLWCDNIPTLPLLDRPSRADAAEALRLIRKSFSTFPFADSVRCQAYQDREGKCPIDVVDIDLPPGQDESGFLLALMTAVCRSSLSLAPGALFTAPQVSGAGSGKGLLVRCICAVAFRIRPRAFTTGRENGELDKRLTAELIEAQPALFLDNANGIALRSDTLASVLTERPARVRVLGESRMAMLNSAAFIAVTGNGLTLTEDLARRFVACNLDAQCEDPESRPFKSGFLETIEGRRGELLTLVLTIWRWGRQNPADLKRGKPLGSYEEWSEWCRDPLLTLGCADPVERIETLKANDPRRQHLAELFNAWWEHHGATPMKAKDLHEAVQKIIDPQGRGRQFLSNKLTSLAGTRAAGFVLTRQAASGKWGTATYALVQPGDGIGHRDHRDHRADGTKADPPMPPMNPMPDAPDDADISPGEEASL